MNRPSVRELECFLAVAEALSFSRAARKLHLSQPPLTRHVQALEEKLGVRLFDRNTRAVSLTTLGSRYVEDVQRILREMDRSVEVLRRAAGGEIDHLTIAFVGALMDADLIQAIQRFRKRNPTCQLHLLDLPPAVQLEELERGKIDGGLMGAVPEPSPKNLAVTTWKQEPFLIALSGDHPLVRRKLLTWANLREERWVLVSQAAAPAFRKQFGSLREKYQLKGPVTHEADRVTAVLTMVAAANGISLVPYTVKNLILEGVVFKKISPQPMLRHGFAFCPEKKNPLTFAFLQELVVIGSRPTA